MAAPLVSSGLAAVNVQEIEGHIPGYTNWTLFVETDSVRHHQLGFASCRMEGLSKLLVFHTVT